MKQNTTIEDIKTNHFQPETEIPAQHPSPTSTRRKKERQYYPWFDGPYDSARGEAALWTAVITQALMDGMSQSKNPEQRYHKQAAIQWLTSGSKDFHMVCMLAGLDSDYVRRKAKKALFSKTAWRAAPGKGSRYQERKAYRARTRKIVKQPTDELAEPAGAVILTGPWQ